MKRVGSIMVIKLLTLILAFRLASFIELPILNTTEAFFISFRKFIFTGGVIQNVLQKSSNTNDVRYRVSLEDKPDLPEWISFVQGERDSYLYGVFPVNFFQMELGRDMCCPSTKALDLRVIAINKSTYETMDEKITLIVKERPVTAKFEVEMGFVDLNVEDLFESDRLDQLIQILQTNLWRTAKMIYITFVESTVKMGGRTPPLGKEGFIVRFGSTTPFTPQLNDLEMQVEPLRIRKPCPKTYRRTSADLFFRNKTFYADWCQFNLHNDSFIIPQENGPVHSSIHLTSDNFRPPMYNDVPKDLVSEFVISVVVPIITSFLVLVVIAFFLCCYHEGIEKRNKETSSIQMVQYASIHRASSNLRTMATKREGPKSCGVTPTSTIQRSYGSSPSGTLQKPINTHKMNENKLHENSINLEKSQNPLH